MSSRVEQENARQAAEAERLQKKIERDSREQRAGDTSRETFSRLVKTNTQGTQDAKRQGEKTRTDRQGEERAGAAAKQHAETERTARTVRGGVVQQSKVMEQARSFQGTLQSQQTQTHQADHGRVERRDQGKARDKLDREDRETGIQRQEQKRDAEAELARVEGREHARPNAAIRDQDRGSGGDSRGDDGTAAALAQAKKAAAPAEGAQAPREVKQIPPELLEKLVSAVYLGVNQKGLKEFQIELKDGPLKGAFLKISADGGKVALRFEGLGADEKRLLEASKGELMRRLGKKGLSLSRFDVS